MAKYIFIILILIVVMIGPGCVGTPVNDTEDTQIENFKIGDSKDMLGVNIKLVSIKIADVNDSNSDDMAIIEVDGVKYEIISYVDEEIKGRLIMVDNIDDSATSADISVNY